MSGPYTFEQARAVAAAASRAQADAEEFIRESARSFALAEEVYRVALAKRIVELHAEGTAWSVCGDIARGDKQVAGLRRKRDIAEGVRDAAQQAAWRRSADRKDTERFIDWSLRQQLADGSLQPAWTPRAAA